MISVLPPVSCIVRSMKRGLLTILALLAFALPAHAVLLPPASPQNVQYQGFCAPGDVSHNGVICRNDPVSNVDPLGLKIAIVTRWTWRVKDRNAWSPSAGKWFMQKNRYVRVAEQVRVIDPDDQSGRKWITIAPPAGESDTGRALKMVEGYGNDIYKPGSSDVLKDDLTNFESELGALRNTPTGKLFFDYLEKDTARWIYLFPAVQTTRSTTWGDRIYFDRSIVAGIIGHEFQHASEALANMPNPVIDLSSAEDARYGREGEGYRFEARAVRLRNVIKAEQMRSEGKTRAQVEPVLQTWYGEQEPLGSFEVYDPLPGAHDPWLKE